MNINRNVLTPALYPAFATVLLLLIPLTAMQFTDEVVWTPSDFMVAAALIFGTGVAYQLISRKSVTSSFKFAAGFALLTGFLLIWVNLAVGIIGSEDHPVNLWYFAVIAVGLIGAFLSRLQPG